MGSGFKDWAAGDVLTAADVDGYLMRQTVMTFADASARDTALSGVLDEGMVAYLEDVNALTVYNGSAWVAVIDSDVLTVDTSNNRVGINDSSPSYALDVTGDINATGALRLAGASIGERVDYTASAALGGVTVGNGTFTYAHYTRINDLVVYMGEFVFGSTSAVTGNVLITLPIVSASGIYTSAGGGVFVDDGTQQYPCYARFANTTATGLFSYYTAGSYGVQGNANATTPFTWTTGDKIVWNLIYQAA